MKQNAANWDRAGRAIMGFSSILAAAVLPWPTWARAGAGMTGVYLLATAVFGACLGYRLLGISTCTVKR